jgi:CheY-like chemotaxis protein
MVQVLTQTSNTRLGAVVRAGAATGLGITQEELAWRADLHRTYVADVERGCAQRDAADRRASGEGAANYRWESVRACHRAAGNRTMRVGRGIRRQTEVQDILLVEHNAAAAKTALAFKRAKLANPLRIVRDGETGLDYLFGTGRYAKRKPVRPQLILLSLNLPKMSGAEFLQRVKSDERTCDIPVVVLTVSH